MLSIAIMKPASKKYKEKNLFFLGGRVTGIPLLWPISATFLLFGGSSVAGFPLLQPISATSLLFGGSSVAGIPLL